VCIVAVVNPRRLYRPSDVAWDTVSEPDNAFMDDDHFNALFDADVLIGLSGGPSGSLEPVAAEAMAETVRNGQAGAVIVGSHVKKTSDQLQQLLQLPSVQAIEIDVARIDSGRRAMLDAAVERAAAAHQAGRHPVLYTSREELAFADQAARLAFGERVSAFLMDVVRRLPEDLGFLISKGGITSNDVLSDGLALRTSRVLGQILPGCSVVRCPDDHPRYPRMPVVIFPGNVGDDSGLATAVERLSGGDG